MSLNIKKLFNSFRKNNSNNDEKYKYDEIIDNKINLLQKKMDTKKDNVINKYKVKRKIPDSKELSKIYNKFIENIPKNNIEIFNFNKNIDTLHLKEGFMLLKLSLNDNKRYKLGISFEINNECTLLFTLNNNNYTKTYEYDKKINGNILFKTNFKYLNKYNELYILFKEKTTIILKNININVQEINNNLDYNVTLLKNNENIYIY